MSCQPPCFRVHPCAAFSAAPLPVGHLRSSGSLPASPPYIPVPEPLVLQCLEWTHQTAEHRWMGSMDCSGFVLHHCFGDLQPSGRLICCPTLSLLLFPCKCEFGIGWQIQTFPQLLHESDCRSNSHCLNPSPDDNPSPSGFKSELEFSGV